MLDTFAIDIEPVITSRIGEMDPDRLEFGKLFADHMLTAEYADGEWQAPRIRPYGPLSISPATSALHYGQAIFEGQKAYRQADGSVAIFRPQANWQRFNHSAERMAMPTIPEDIFVQGMRELVRQDASWVPSRPGSSLYLRPYMFATDGFLGVRPSATYHFGIITCPVSAFFGQPLRVRFEQKYVRAAAGGAGYAKNAGNYGAAMLPSSLAQREGYHQLLWTDASEHQYVEESGAMNVMFVIDGVLVTPALSTSILDGITRRSVLELARDWGMPTEERRVSSREIVAALGQGKLQEAFGVGTAATIAPIAIIGHEGHDYTLPEVPADAFSRRVGAALEAIRTGQAPDPHHWMVPVQG
ncbi:branched-chain amino acid aminotransferase [Hymenobacter sp. RP-2-7]|uniref:branched-chain-amino-acid transaminase n=1 Tax=Hymenobacter polaris TaxID=2682546 RepID=A0A7Y0FPE9_9BACT|nr:branched-chain amino acid aminotransferase [Hymenobacter polaris]NML67485.1 branched-chain amino acid aminotransferase [Hymenobacter polaris]